MIVNNRDMETIENECGARVLSDTLVENAIQHIAKAALITRASLASPARYIGKLAFYKRADGSEHVFEVTRWDNAQQRWYARNFRDSSDKREYWMLPTDEFYWQADIMKEA